MTCHVFDTLPNSTVLVLFEARRINQTTSEEERAWLARRGGIRLAGRRRDERRDARGLAERIVSTRSVEMFAYISKLRTRNPPETGRTRDTQ